MGRRLKETVSKEDTQMTKKHMKRWSTSLIIREMYIKTTVKIKMKKKKSTMRFHLTSVRMTIIKKINSWNLPTLLVGM